MAIDESRMRIAEVPKEPLEPFPNEDPYGKWQQREGVRVIVDYAFEDINEIELTPWERKGGFGAIINIPYHSLYNDSHVVEIAPGETSAPERHLYEEQVYVASGSGSTSVWLDGGEKQTFEWNAGAIFGIPLNAWYQHFNTSGVQPARYLAVTNAPQMMRLIADNDVMFHSAVNFTSRFGGENGYFSGDGKLYRRRIWETNFIPNAPDIPLYSYEERGAGGVSITFEIARGSMKSHISEFPVGTYKKAHRHGAGAHLVILSGTGFSLLWTKDDQSDMRKADWSKNGMVIVPSDGCFHQHFNTGPTRARYLALRPGNMGLVAPGTYTRPINLSTEEGGDQIEYEHEARQVHEIFEADLAKHGAPCLMRGFIPYCTGEVGPTDERLT